MGDLGVPSPKTTNGEPIVEGVEARLLNRVVKVTREGWEFLEGSSGLMNLSGT